MVSPAQQLQIEAAQRDGEGGAIQLRPRTIDNKIYRDERRCGNGFGFLSNDDVGVELDALHYTAIRAFLTNAVFCLLNG